eukprot:TRINITY_DN25389_c0_g3_i1.p1 TRINITY_DN25389_c0_g3~~TRINITY_DN25389_c0_g3_i1.p1  ORF type:complete len:559 (-),score=133.76 TRINITY_DN25389_c0_g3_i1:268-1830(-)
MGAPRCTTSLVAYQLAKKLTDEYEGRRKKEKEMNLRKTKEVKPSTGGVTRQVTEIDYQKHEKTVAELQRQEEEEEFNRKQIEASRWCKIDHVHGPECKQQAMGCSHDHQKEWQIYDKSTEEKLDAAKRFREEGNEAFRKQNYGLAAVHYRKALLQFDYTFGNGEEEERKIEEAKLPCLLNLAACKCQQEEWDEVLTQCRLALEINPRSVKAYFRRGIAYLNRDQFDLARDALESAYEIEPHNPDVRNTWNQLQKRIASYKKRTKDVSKEMLSGQDVQEENAATRDEPAGAAAAAEATPASASASPRRQRVASGASGAAASSATETPRSSLGIALRVCADFDGETVLTQDLAQCLLDFLPIRLRMPGAVEWNLRYAPRAHGVSLATLYRNLALSGASVFLVKDHEGYVFGGFAPAAWEPRGKFYGSGEAFVFSFGLLEKAVAGGKMPEPAIYPWTSKNSFFMYADSHGLGMGGGDGHFAWTLQSDLLHGHSSPTDTFGNATLASGQDFVATDVEVWTLDEL